MSDHLFLFTIGPVQSFISQARKTQDLYAGSYLLSHLCRIAGKKAEEISGNKTIFPKLDNKSIPNRFIIRFNLAQDLQTIGQEIENSVWEEIKKITNTILKKLNIEQPPYHFYEQLQHFFSVYWLFYPIDNNGYAHAYREIERLLGAVKNVRSFKQLEEIGRKCSLDGKYNALFYNVRGNGRPPAFVEKKYNGLGDPIEFKNDTRIQAGEGLSAISFLKRFLKDANLLLVPEHSFLSDFPSTARVSLLHILSKYENSGNLNGQIIFKKYKDKFGKDFDEQLYYEENLTSNYFEKKGLENIVGAIPRLKNDLEDIKKFVSKEGLSLTKYYALIMFDADDMGKWNSGEFLKEQAKNDLEQFHKTLTSKLSDFGKYAQEYIDFNEYGKTVYAGGDDYLGFVNLNYLFKVIQRLREEFKKHVDLSEFSDNKMTFSAGVVIAHYKTPLSEVLKWTRKMEKTAKEMKYKNAFAIAVLKHSGEIVESVLPWLSECEQDKQVKIWLPKVIEHLTRNLEKKYFSNTFIHNLSNELLRLKDHTNDLPSDLNKETIECEIKRLVNRSYMDTSVSEELRKKRIEKINQNVILLFNTCMENWKQQPVSNFLSILHIADFISREVNYVD
jgi:CRISPR-associated protein Cmr2